ncbi:Protein FAR1-RELATED SEQUENCE 5 [Linum grandiflorum]
MAGIRTTFRCEGLNSQISKHVKHSSKLLQFFLGFDQLISEMREVELNLDFKCIQRAPEIRYSPLRSLKRSAAALFSTKAFKKFRAQLDLCSGCIKDGVEIDGNSHIYTVSMYEPDTPPRTVRVTYDTSTDSAGCNCCRFDDMGIPCTHMIFVLKEEGKSVILQSYVMHRWSKNPKNWDDIQQPQTTNEAQRRQLRHEVLQYSTMEMFKLGTLSAEGCKVAQEGVKELIEKLRTLHLPDAMNTPVIVEGELKGIQDPEKVKFKGCGAKKGKNAIKTKKYGICRETGHYRTSFPDKDK